MMRIAKCLRYVILALWFGNCAVGQQTETLAEVLTRNSIRTNTVPSSRLDSRITSYAVLNDPQEFAIAYYLFREDNELRFPLLILRLDKRTGEWRDAELKDLPVFVHSQTNADTFSVDCLGSVLRIRHEEDRYYLDLHFNPSAGCLLILKQDFTVDATLPGWHVAFLKGLVLWEQDMIHFASTHPAQLWMYDVRRKNSERLYPQLGDPLREDFKHRLAAVADPNKCRTYNWPCNPDQFGSDIEDVAVNQQTGAFAIRVGFSTEGFLTREEAENSGAWDDDEYVYIYRLNPFGWRAFSIYDLKPKFGTDSLTELLAPDKLRVAFALHR
jgi:hypothetical protein